VAAASICLSLAGAAGENEGEALSKEAGLLLGRIPKPMFLYRPKGAVPADLKAAASALHQRIFTEASAYGPENPLPAAFTPAIRDAFRANLIVNWPTLPAAEGELKRWWELLKRFPVSDDDPAAARLALKISRDTVATWLQENPKGCSRLIDEIHAEIQPFRHPSLASDWAWSFPRYDLSLRTLAQKVQEPDRTALVGRSLERNQEVMDMQSVPLAQRTNLVAQKVNQLYSMLNIAAAVELIASWEKQHPAALQDSFWLMQRYFVAAVGEGNHAQAAETFHRLEQLAEQKRFDPQDSFFKLISQDYYNSLPQAGMMFEKQAFLRRQQFTRP
jgi:hypothetical protein